MGKDLIDGGRSETPQVERTTLIAWLGNDYTDVADALMAQEFDTYETLRAVTLGLLSEVLEKERVPPRKLGSLTKVLRRLHDHSGAQPETSTGALSAGDIAGFVVACIDPVDAHNSAWCESVHTTETGPSGTAMANELQAAPVADPAAPRITTSLLRSLRNALSANCSFEDVESLVSNPNSLRHIPLWFLRHTHD